MSQQLFDQHLETIDRVITWVSRQHLLSDDDAREFRSRVHLKLLENDCAVLRKHRGDSSLFTFLAVVCEHELRDHRNSVWGKWRPSIEARRNGPHAVLLEQLTIRDGYTFEQAFEILRTNHHVTRSRAELEELFARLPLRVMRKTQTDDVLVVVPAPGPTPEMIVSREELRPRVAHVREVLLRVLRELEAIDRLIIKLRFLDGLSVVEIARLLALDQKALYRRIDRVKGRLRRRLEEEGVDPKTLFDDDEPWG